MTIADNLDDTFIALCLEAASRSVDDLTGRQFGVVASAEERIYPVVWDLHYGLYVAEIDDLQTTDNLVVTVDGASLASTSYRLEPRNAAANGDPWTELYTDNASEPALGSGPLEVAVTAEWGWTAVPDTIKQCTLIQANRLYFRRRSPAGVAGSPSDGSELRMLARSDPDAWVLSRIARYNRDRLFV